MARTTELTIGETTLTRIGLGTNRLTNTPQNVGFVRQAVAAGVNMIDTAHNYTGGESEATIGEALSTAPADFVVATKGGYSAAEANPDALRAQIAESLRRLRSERIGLYYLHRIHPEVPLEQSLAVLAEHRDAGTIGHVGVSEASVEEVDRARAVVPIAAVQNHYNLTERRHEQVVDYCAAAGIMFVPYFPLRGGGPPELDEIAARHEATRTQIIARVATAALADDAADPRHPLARAPTREPGRARDRAQRRRVRGVDVADRWRALIRCTAVVTMGKPASSGAPPSPPNERSTAMSSMTDEALPPVVDRAAYQAERDALLAREKAHTRAGDALAAARRRLPMVEVDAATTLIGPSGPVSLLDVFEGRSQLIAYFHMWYPAKPAPEQCEGCTFYNGQVRELSYLHSRDVTYATFCYGPYEESVRYRNFMGWDVPWYSVQIGRAAASWTPIQPLHAGLLSPARGPAVRDLLDHRTRRRGHGAHLWAVGYDRVWAPGELGGLARRMAAKEDNATAPHERTPDRAVAASTGRTVR